MTTELPIEWDGFTSTELRRIKTQWSRIQFARDFTTQFSGKISKGAAGEPGMFFFDANDLTFFREHYSGLVDFTDMDDVIEKSARLATTFYEGLVKQGVLSAD